MDHLNAIDHIIKAMQNELPDNLRYHSLQHTLDVMRSCENLAAKHNVEGENLNLLLTAAAFHDSGFIYTYKNHEERGCQIVKEKLPKFGYSQKQVDAINGMIMATKIPQSPTNLLEKILCDADLDYLGGDQYDEISGQLLEELGLFGFELSKEEWLNMQINFLESHHYWTEVAVQSLTSRKNEVLERLKSQKRDFQNTK